MLNIRNGNKEFVYINFKIMEKGELKQTVVNEHVKEKNMEFLYRNYEYIDDDELKNQIIKYAFREENVEFLNEHLTDMPKDMKLEAAIKFKNLKISKEELALLMKR